ncbi:serine/threonine-protein kinase [Paenibacillus sp. MSJ-34]|uniref:serine/threonine protein kinase n=2 Tax=unclassified Paenibacillus TaxID=185978 RepID=UPI001C0FDAF2|nr:serine/threonine-protein kinase [Paenibacillus sp. MSJ-34]MBU5443155.1 serine/threonine protein kinase [Paenibacillus sp. MSJ-34]CAH0121167.1 Serine/threonine-protein kinase PknD [Paenibacillus sp. CECT 9249]
MNMKSKLVPQSVVGGRYRVIGRIGAGGMSSVYLVEDDKLKGKRWALKETVVPDKTAYRNVAEEAEMLIRLNHPFLPRIVDFFAPDEDGLMYLVMDYIEGETLACYFARHNGKLPFKAVVGYGLQLCEVLHYLHTRNPPVVYRDMKPSNVMVTPQGQIRLIDFGIARRFKPSQSDDTIRLGTVGFAAPEQYEGQQSETRSDLYGLGALLMHLLSAGRATVLSPQYERLLQDDVPPGFRPVLAKLLQYDPKDRYSSAEQARNALLPFAQPEASGIARQSAAAAFAWIGTAVVAVGGVSKGVGTTHTAIVIAHYLARRKVRVAIRECGGEEAFARIESAYEGLDGQFQPTERFAVNGVEYIKGHADLDMQSMLAEGYDFLVLDLGNVCESNDLSEFFRANFPIVVASGAEWRQQDLRRFLQRYGDKEKGNWKYFIPLANRRTVRDIQKSFQLRSVTALPFHPDPFAAGIETNQRLDAVFADWIASKGKGGRTFSRFGMRIGR